MARGDTSTSEPTSGHRKRIAKWIGLGAVVLILLLGAMRFAHPLFPVEEQASCTVTSPSDLSDFNRRGPDRFPTIGTDCGSFTADDEVTCTADPSRTVQLITGTTYDLAVRGPRVPLVSDPTVTSAQVSSEQTIDSPETPEFGDDPTSDKLKALSEQYSPENLAAWDYDQPPYHQLCDATRTIMTTKGLQMMTPAMAAEALAVPAGITPREPKRPCEGWQCEEH